MPTTDERIARRLAEAAVEPTSRTDEVLAAVTTKRHRRVARRRAVTAGVGGLLVALVVVSAALVAGDPGGDDPVAIPERPRSRGVAVRIVDGWPASLAAPGGDPATARRVVLDPDRGYVRGPVHPSGEFVAVATYDEKDGGFSFPPSRVVRIDGTGRVLDEVELQGEVRSLADGEGARWVLTRDAVVLGPEDAEYRVKRIGPDGTVSSDAVPPGEVPVGDIAASGGGVWVPVRDGVLRYDPATGAYAGKIALAPVARRQVVAAGKGAAATTGAGIARLDPAGMVAIGPDAPARDDADAQVVIDAAAGSTATWALVGSPAGSRLVAVDADGVLDPAAEVALPADFVAERLRSAGGRLWVTGRTGDRAAVVVVQELADARTAVVERVVVVERPGDAAIAVTDHRTVTIAQDGELSALRVTG